MRDFITTDISRCRAKNVLYHPTTGRKSNLITLVSHHHGWVRFQVSDKKLVNHTPDLIQWIIIRVSTGIPGYGLRTEMIRKFFQFPLWKRFQKTGIPERFPERFFFRKTEISGTLSRNYGSLRNSGISFRKIVPEISGFRNNWYHNYIKVLHM